MSQVLAGKKPTHVSKITVNSIIICIIVLCAVAFMILLISQ